MEDGAFKVQWLATSASALLAAAETLEIFNAVQAEVTHI